MTEPIGMMRAEHLINFIRKILIGGPDTFHERNKATIIFLRFFQRRGAMRNGKFELLTVELVAEKYLSSQMINVQVVKGDICDYFVAESLSRDGFKITDISNLADWVAFNMVEEKIEGKNRHDQAIDIIIHYFSYELAGQYIDMGRKDLASLFRNGCQPLTLGRVIEEYLEEPDGCLPFSELIEQIKIFCKGAA
jgi:hypothetical protein